MSIKSELERHEELEAAGAALEAGVNVRDVSSAEARARRQREKKANMTASEKLKSNATVVVAVIAGVVVSLVKFIAAAITGSSAMFSEGIHSMVDAINDSLLLVGGRMAKRKPDVKHPFGYAREEYFYSHTVALVIFVLGGGVAIYEGIRNVMAGGSPIENPFINYIVLGIGIVFEGFSLSVAVRTVNKARGDMRIMKYIRESKSPTNITVFLEDTAAVGGMAVALVGNILSTITGNYVIDAWASIIIGGIMAVIALILLHETRSLVIGEGLTVEEVKDVVSIVEDDPATIKCGRVLSMYLGPEDMLMNLDVTFRENLSEGEVLMAIDRIEEEIIDGYPQTTRIFIEAESLNQVYRQRRDRKLTFRDYEEDKRAEEHPGSSAGKRDDELARRIRERRAERRAQLAARYGKMVVSGANGAEQDTEIDWRYALGIERKNLFDEIPRIEGARIVLDRVVDSDADTLQDLIDNPNVQRYLPAFLFENQRDDVHETISLLYGDLFTNKESLILAIRLKDDGELVGLIELYGLRDALHKVSIGYRLRESFWGKGFATEAVEIMVGYLYGTTDIEIITASVMVENAASSHTLERCDFIRTARYEEEDWGYPEPTIVDKWFY